MSKVREVSGAGVSEDEIEKARRGYFMLRLPEFLKESDPGVSADAVAGHVELPHNRKLELLRQRDKSQRLIDLNRAIDQQIDNVEFECELNEKVRIAAKEEHRDIFLREQLKQVLSEIGDVSPLALYNPISQGRSFKTDQSLVFVLRSVRFIPLLCMQTRFKQVNRIAKCACKNVEVSVKGDPVRFIACHCDYCQRITGSVASLSAIYKEEDIVSVKGKTTTYELPNWPSSKMHFCSVCGTTVHWVNPGPFPGMHMISAGCFADPNFPAPDTVTQTKYRHSWCPEFEGAEHYEEYSGK